MPFCHSFCSSLGSIFTLQGGMASSAHGHSLVNPNCQEFFTIQSMSTMVEFHRTKSVHSLLKEDVEIIEAVLPSGLFKCVKVYTLNWTCLSENILHMH